MDRLPNASWLNSRSIQAVFDAVEQEGDAARVVGGAVRNSILQHPVRDIDIASMATPEVVVARAEAAGLKVIPTGVDHGTVTIISGGIPYEVTTLRQDVETFGRQARVVFGRSWADDARRRDFTMNAIYADRFGGIHDPLGGYDDCLFGRVRFIGDPDQRIKEDYLRVLRFFRIHAAYGRGVPDPAGISACVRQRDGLRQLSAERIGAEMKKLVAAPGAPECLALMEDSGLLEITTGGISRIKDFQALRQLDGAAEETREPALGFAVLAGFVDEDLDRVADRFRLSNTERKRMFGALHARDRFPQEKTWPSARDVLFQAGRQAAIDGLLSAWALDRAGCQGSADDARYRTMLAQLRSEPVPVFPLKGADLLAAGFPPGPTLGTALGRLQDIWLASGFTLSRAELLARVADAMPSD